MAFRDTSNTFANPFLYFYASNGGTNFLKTWDLKATILACRFLRDRVREVPGLTNALEYPHAEFTTGRALRTSPIFPKLKQAGAQFGQVSSPQAGVLFGQVGGFTTERG